MDMRTVLLAIILAGALAPTQANSVEFALSLDGVTAGTFSPATGNGTYISYDESSRLLSLVGGYGGATGGVNLLGDFSVAQIHNFDGSVFASLSNVPFPGVSSQSGLLYGTIDYSVSPGAEAELVGGLQYVSIHTTLYPAGEISGYLVPLPEPGTLALIGPCVLGLLAFQRRLRSCAS